LYLHPAKYNRHVRVSPRKAKKYNPRKAKKYNPRKAKKYNGPVFSQDSKDHARYSAPSDVGAGGAMGWVAQELL
jgi:hypothetical protein